MMLFAQAAEELPDFPHSIPTMLISIAVLLLAGAVTAAVRSLIVGNRKLMAVELGSAHIVQSIEELKDNFVELTKSFTRDAEMLNHRWQKADKAIALLEHRMHAVEAKSGECEGRRHREGGHSE